MNYISCRNALLCSVALLLAGCVQRAPMLESQFGQSVTLLRAQQVINPDAGRNADSVSGMDSKAAKSGYDQYQKSFRSPDPQPNAFTIGIGGGR